MQLVGVRMDRGLALYTSKPALSEATCTLLNTPHTTEQRSGEGTCEEGERERGRGKGGEGAREESASTLGV